jgi:hypothetical protein
MISSVSLSINRFLLDVVAVFYFQLTIEAEKTKKALFMFIYF